MRLVICLLFFFQFNSYSDETVPYLTVLKPRSVMLPDSYDLEFLELEQVDPEIDLDKFDVKTHIIAPYGGVHYAISREKLNGFHGVVGIYLAKGKFKGLGVAGSSEDEDKVERFTYSLLSAMLGSSDYQFSGIDIRGSFNDIRSKYSLAYSFVDGSTFFFIPAWYRLRAGVYAHKAKDNFQAMSAAELYDDEVGIDLSVASALGFVEFEFGVEIGKKLHQAGWGIRPNASLSLVLPLYIKPKN